MKKFHKKIKSGSRGSKLALIQVKEIKTSLKAKGIDCVFDNKVYETQGDKDKNIALTDEKVADNFFTDTLDKAILNHEIDIAIHSAKDLPEHIPEGLTIFALTASADSSDAFIGKKAFKDLSAGSKIGTSSVIRQEAIKALNPNLEIKDIRGTIEERIQLFEEGEYDGIIAATIALKRLGLEKYIQDIMPWETSPLQGQLAVVGRREDKELKELFKGIDVRQTYGKVTLVGAGPGDKDLITQKGINALKETECVFYDYLLNEEILEYAPQAEKIYVGKRKGTHALSQKDLSKLLRDKAMSGKNSVRLKGGDPFIFGRGAEEQEYLRSYYIEVDIIPGVTSATAIPAILGIPLTSRGIASSVAFVSGHREVDAESHDVEIPNTDTIVFLMGLTKLEAIISSLQKAGRTEKTPVAIIAKGTWKDQQVIYGTIADIQAKVKKQKPATPALIIVGETIHYAHSLYRN